MIHLCNISRINKFVIMHKSTIWCQIWIHPCAKILVWGSGSCVNLLSLFCNIMHAKSSLKCYGWTPELQDTLLTRHSRKGGVNNLGALLLMLMPPGHWRCTRSYSRD